MSEKSTIKARIKTIKQNNLTMFPGVEKVKQWLFLKGIWNATLTEDNVLYIEIIRGQMVNKEQWQTMKGMAASMPEALKDTIDGFFATDWSKF
jgi:hypothetical protein